MYLEPVKRKKGTVYRVIVKGNGRTKTKTFARKIDAHSWGLQTEAMLKHTTNYRITFKQLYETWFENHAKVRKAPSSIRGDKSNIRPILEIIGDKSVDEIRIQDIDRVVAHLKSLGSKGNKTINRYLTLAQTVFNYGVRIDCLMRSPVKPDHFLPEDEIGYEYWQRQEAEKFLEYVEKKYSLSNPQTLLFYLVALNTGMRWGEIAALKWDCILLRSEIKQSMVIVKRSYCNITKQIRETTKGHKVRYIGMNDVLYAVLKEAYAKRDQNNDLVFHTLNGTVFRISNFISRYFKKDVKQSGVRPIRFHDLRHSYASQFVMNGGSIYDLQKILGHTDIQTTMRYAHLAKEHILSKADLVVLGRRDNVVRGNFGPSKTASL